MTRLATDDDGMWIITAKLPQVEGGLLVKAIEEVTRQQEKNDSAESFSQKNADGLCLLGEHYIATAKVDGFRVSDKNDWLFKTNSGEVISASPPLPPSQPVELSFAA